MFIKATVSIWPLKHLKTLFVKPASISFYKIKKALSLLYYYPAAWFAKQKLQHTGNNRCMNDTDIP